MTEDVVFALEHQDKLQPLYTGGSVFHTYLGESVTDKTALKNFIIKAFTNTKLPYLSITPTFSICKDHGYIAGEHFECPECHDPTEGLYAYRGLLPPGFPLEPRQTGRIQRPDGLRQRQSDVGSLLVEDFAGLESVGGSGLFFCGKRKERGKSGRWKGGNASGGLNPFLKKGV